jgi:hypothetical protein
MVPEKKPAMIPLPLVGRAVVTLPGKAGDEIARL